MKKITFITACLLAGTVAFAGTGLQQRTAKKHAKQKHHARKTSGSSSETVIPTGEGTSTVSRSGIHKGDAAAGATGSSNGTGTDPVPPNTKPPVQ